MESLWIHKKRISAYQGQQNDQSTRRNESMKAHQDTNEETKNLTNNFEIVANDESSILDENLKTSINNISSCSSDNSDSDSSMDCRYRNILIIF